MHFHVMRSTARSSSCVTPRDTERGLPYHGSMSSELLRGNCFCGFVQYEVAGPFWHQTHCTCETCRRTSGAPLVPWATASRSAFRILSGTPASFQSSAHGTRTFCPRCGTPLTFSTTQYPNEIDFTLCSFQDPEALPPKDVTFASSMPQWLPEFSRLPAFPKARPGT